MDKLYLSSYDECYIVDLDEILYIMADDHYCKVTYLSGANIMLPYGLGKIEEYITRHHDTTSNLQRMGRKYIININYMLHISTTKQTLILSDKIGNKHSLRIAKPILRELIDNIRRNNEFD